MSSLSGGQRMEMDKVFAAQVIVSFVVGGGLVSFLSLIAEKVPDKYAGMVLSLPSTVAISFFFFSLIHSPANIPDIVPSVIASLGSMLVLIVFYLYFSRIQLRKGFSILLSTVGSVLAWSAFSIPIAITHFSNYFISVIFYVAIALISHFLIAGKIRNGYDASRLSYNFSSKLLRVCVAGFIIALSVYLSKSAGIFWGGIFSVFPAAFLSTLIIFHWHYNSDFLFQVSRNVPLGSSILLFFVITARYTFPTFGNLLGTMLAYISSILLFFVIVVLKGRTYGKNTN